MSEPHDTFPRQYARTQRLSLGEPRSITVSPNGRRVVFCRSPAGDDPATMLWVLDVESGTERVVADPRALLGADRLDTAALPPEERARRERARESAAGITAYATDRAVTVVAFALAGELFVGGLVSASARPLPVPGPVFDPRPDPTARRVAYVCDRSLRIAELDGSTRTLAGEDDPNIHWGTAEFVAAEEMGRSRGYWWAPDGTRLAVARVDLSPVATWWLADPSEPWQPPTKHAYPAAGTANADVSLAIVGLDGFQVRVDWDRDAFPYLCDVQWELDHPLTVTVQSRDQTRLRVLQVEPLTGVTTVLADLHEEPWIDLVPGVPTWLAPGQLVTAGQRDGTRRLLVDGTPLTPEHLDVRSVVGRDDDHLLVVANWVEEPTEQHVWRVSSDSAEPLTTAPGVHTASAGGGTVVVRSASLDHPGTRTIVQRADAEPITLASHAEEPLVRPAPTFEMLGERAIRTALFWPTGFDPGSGERLPVLVDPYGGPHHARVVKSHNAHLNSQWLADQGFAVLVADGRGTPGRGGTWEQAVHLDLAGPVLDDQVAALHEAAARFGALDLDRVAIRGWSFGGFLAALAVLRRPDVFHAAIAGAPVTDWRLYDTHYTERYLGHPDEQPDAYARSSLIDDAPTLTRPLLLIHGLSDDNVVSAHTLQLSRALLRAGRPHQVLPLTGGITHMANQPDVAENLLLVQVDFLRRALGIAAPAAEPSPA